MNIPPFPSQDLAKLVLGYLAEEQLMTAYDEFLQASPYLDALGNEYDRIFMTSLKNILAEYRAVKIYVETCKPFTLRKKMFQCVNLLEMVKFLVQNVDIEKLQIQENNNQTKYSLEKQTSSGTSTSSTCEICNSLKLDNCTCKSKNSISSTPSNTHISTSSKENSVETTPLSDLPGSHVTCRKKNARVLNKELPDFNSSTELGDVSSKLTTNNEFIHRNLTNNFHQARLYTETQESKLATEKPDSLEFRQKEEFNHILNQVCTKNECVDKNIISKLEDIDKQSKVSLAGYNDFATGVNSGDSVASITVPDSSTSENMHVQIPATKDNQLINLEQPAKVTHTKTQYLLKVANVKNNLPIQPNEIVSISTVNTNTTPRIIPRPEESKIKIISDIKVDKTFNKSDSKMPTVLKKTATSTPLLQMQTIVINGTPVYKHDPYGQKHNFTKDEIMAMPTIILAPAPPPGMEKCTSQTTAIKPAESGSNQYIPTSTSARPLGPLIIDIAANNSNYVSNTTNISNQTVVEQNIPVEENKKEITNAESSVTKAVDITSASAPKDNTITGNPETSTPQVFPPVRKSSSTPRRTSHIRVLDFTTPRRILHETINKCLPQNPLDGDKEVVLSKSPNVLTPASVEHVDERKLEEGKSGSLKENNSTKKLPKNWDADLRVLATVSESLEKTASPKPKSKPKAVRKSKAKDQNTKKVDKKDVDKGKKKRSSKVKLPMNKSPSDDEVEIITVPDEKNDIPVKPTINIIAGIDRNPNTSTEINKSQNKSNNDENIDTPEMERISLQNEIGAKLNISDLLETPYKQVLYDMQMDTPRFLGHDILDDGPMSDIKITNIPTPRFLTSAATPSSYSSRPTDYSSGGSYYKPEDQDYMRVHDESDCPVTSTKESVTNDSSNKDSDDSKEKENLKPTRPVRECTKNVSYKLASTGNRSRNIDNKGDMDSSIDSTGDEVIEKITPNTPITPKVNKNKSNLNRGSIKKRKTPIKKEMVKSFMKIKPRRPTPTKNTNVKSKRKSVDTATQSKVQTKKKATKKELSVNATPVTNPAPTKSRRKSSTPRKLHCSKSFHSESSGHDSPEFVSKSTEKTIEHGVVHVHDSDTEQLPLRWSDDGSQEPQPVVISIPNDSDDITQIKEYIETTHEPKQRFDKEEVSLHIDLVKRGFDLETAKIIERDLLDTPPLIRQDSGRPENINISTTVEIDKVTIVEDKVDDVVLEKTVESETSNKMQIVQNDDEEVDEEIELSVHDCNEESSNYFTYEHDATIDTCKKEPTKLKDKYCMEFCIDDGVSIRLRATPFSLLVDQDPQTVEYLNYSYRETEMAVSSISNFEKLYTPLKESLKAQCYEIFDSTLTSLDTPLKARSPKRVETEVSVTEIVLEVEKVEEKEKLETKKRKRGQSGNVSDESGTESKKAKPETQLLFNSTNIQNFDIDSVLSKLHGP